ncbi:MAG: hypothetical protein A2X94_13115 [Bdellovibrionales bacterium GWB1_55_8]|nr:MAG: hypothetical protein A2X94_13115 [Bdellovibrionales bacterium GWB1_55_8]
MAFRRFAALLNQTGRTKHVRFNDYSVVVHAPELVRFIRPDYRATDLLSLIRHLSPHLHIAVNERGMVPAAERFFEESRDPTHYDAVWVRDSLWAYLGLRAQGRVVDAKRILLCLLQYISTPAQQGRLRRGKPLHIRFDPESKTFSDVREGGKIQQWNHKQNDAVGLLFDLLLRALSEGLLTQADIPRSGWDSLALLPAYFEKIRFADTEDAGCWEEIERVNTSSVGLVTSALERLQQLMTRKAENDRVISRTLLEAAGRNGVGESLRSSEIERLVSRGYRRIRNQLERGGESPLYSVCDPRHRGSDAALLNLIYPARLERLTFQEKMSVVALVQPLVGMVGVRRYFRDSYQSGNYWFSGSERVPVTRRKGLSRSAAEFVTRGTQYIDGTEAQWFFDSWYSKALGLLHRQSGEFFYREKQLQFLNRALAQITAGESVLGADGRPVPPFSLPESYNSIVSDGAQYFVPSPIAPLTWAKACLAIALSELSKPIR